MDVNADAQEPSTLSRRTAIGLLISAGVLPSIGLASGRPQPAAADPGTSTGPYEVPLSQVPKAELQFTRVGQIAGETHRVTFYRAGWLDPDGQRCGAIVRDLEVMADGSWLAVSGEAERFDEQWVLHTGAAHELGGGFYGSAAAHWLAIDSFTRRGTTVAELKATAPGVAEITIRWDVSGHSPELQWSLTALRDDNLVVGYYGGASMAAEDATEVMCGALQHARVIGSQVALLSWELFSPMALVQTGTASSAVTTGVYIPSEVLEFEHPRMGWWDNQPFGMSLRNGLNEVQTCVYAPPGGKRSVVSAGQQIGYAFGLVVSAAELYDAQVQIARDEYNFTRYRRNVYGQSMTDTVHNLMELVAVEPDGDDSEDFIPSVSGWWDRAKGFCNIEGEQQVRTATAGVLLSANLLASAPDEAARFYRRRARPYVEHIYSRRNIGYSPKQGYGYYDSLCGNGVVGITAMSPIWHLLKGQAAGMNRLMMRSHGASRVDQGSLAAAPFREAINAYQATDDPAWLAEAVALAKRHIRDAIDVAYTTNVSTSSFGHTAVKSWLELLVLYDLTGDEELLRAAHTEAKRYMGLFMLRPVPKNGATESPVGEVILDQYYQWKDADGIPEYPRELPPTERVESWELSPTGLSFEQLSTYLRSSSNPGGGLTLNPIWAPFLSRLAELVDDDFIRDMAHNMVVGRFTNYPGYYNRQLISWPADPRFPYEGPPETSSVYYHHMPAQLGLAIDHLISEHQIRSGGKISFPYVFESIFVYFKYHIYGHAPGTFYGDQGVWPYFPPGMAKLSNHQVNWLTAVSADALYLSLTNASAEDQQTMVSFDHRMAGLERSRRYRVEVFESDGRISQATLANGKIRLVVPGHGHLAVKIPGAGHLMPWHYEQAHPDRSNQSYHFDDFDAGGGDGNGTFRDRAYAMLVPRPDRTGYDAYLQSSVPDGSEISVRYRIGAGDWQVMPDKPYPYEWTIEVDELTASFSYQVSYGTTVRPIRTLRLPSSVTGQVAEGQDVDGELVARGSTAPGDEVPLTVRVRGGSRAIIGARLTIYPPNGWSADRTVAELDTIEPDSINPVSFTLVPSESADPSSLVTAAVSWRDESGANHRQPLAPTMIRVARALSLIEIAAPVTRSWGPDDPLAVTAAIMNRGPQARSGTAQLTVPAGWAADHDAIDWTAAGRDFTEVRFTLRPVEAAPGAASFELSPGGGLPADSITVTRLDPTNQIVVPGDPGYSEFGSWLRSGLAGVNGSTTRYSPEDVWGGQVTWTAEIKVTGSYQISIWYPSNADTTTDALYTVTAGSVTEEFHVDQTVDASSWRALGSYELSAGDVAILNLKVVSGKYTRVNAARFVKVG